MSDDHLQATITQKAALFGPNGDVLLLRRASTDRWDVPGGRLGASEGVVSGLRREIREETGLDVAVEEPIYTDAWRTEDGDNRYAVVFRCTAESRAIELSDEHDEWQWVDPTHAVDEVLAAGTLRAAVERAAKRRTVVP